VALDAVVARMMGVEPSLLRFMQIASERGLGSFDQADIEIIGELQALPDFKLPPCPASFGQTDTMEELIVSRILLRPVADPDSCTGCGTCVEHCPASALSMPEDVPWWTRTGASPVSVARKSVRKGHHPAMTEADIAPDGLSMEQRRLRTPEPSIAGPRLDGRFLVIFRGRPGRERSRRGSGDRFSAPGHFHLQSDRRCRFAHVQRHMGERDFDAGLIKGLFDPAAEFAGNGPLLDRTGLDAHPDHDRRIREVVDSENLHGFQNLRAEVRIGLHSPNPFSECRHGVVSSL
jgi:ferredoxin